MRRRSVPSSVRSRQQLGVGHTFVPRVGRQLRVDRCRFSVTTALLLIIQPHVGLALGLGWRPGRYYRRYRHNAVAR